MIQVPSADPDDRIRALSEPARRRALSEVGLTAEPDPAMEVFADRVRRRLDVPVALVSLVSADEQVFPGMAGLPEPWASARSTPLTHSFCQHVVVSAEPLVVTDAREHPLVRDNLAVSEIGVVGYAGMPLTDTAGTVLGSLCAIDTRPREWTAVELDALREIAETCSTELRLRLSQLAARTERDRRDKLEDRLRRSFDRSQALLTAAQSFADTVTVEDVRVQVGELVRSDLHPSYVGLALIDDQGLMRRMHDARFPHGAADGGPLSVYDVRTRLPTATAVRERRLVVYPDRETYDADHDELGRTVLRDLGLHAIVAAPLLDADGSMGAVGFGWDRPRRFDAADLLAVTTIAGFAAQALDRALRLQHRSSVAEQLQRAMLTTLPDVPGLQLAGRYEPADSREHVGGDWYDAATLPDDGSCPLMLSVGDIVGHDLAAATVMGQVRSMLRQAAWDQTGRPPSQTLTAFEQAAAGLGVPAAGTAVLAHLCRRPSGEWSMTWTNAGHPPPVLVLPGAAPVLLGDHDRLFGFPSLPPAVRRDHRRDLPPGSTIFLHTDGLIEARGGDIDAGTERLLRLLDTHRDAGARALVDTAVDTLARDSPDDVVAVAVHVER